MELTREKITNILLGSLIFLSFFLSYHLWTAGGNIDEVKEDELQTANNKISMVDHNIEDAFRPSLIALHGISSSDDILLSNTYPLRNFLNATMEKTNLFQVEYDRMIEFEEYIDMLATNDWIELIFNEKRPIGLLEDKFAELSQDMSNQFFDRMIINIKDQDELYLYHTETRDMYTAAIIEGESLDIDPFINLENLNYEPAEITIFLDNIVYLPTETTRVPYRSYVIDKLPTSTYISDFFPDTSLVDVRSTETYTRYIDLSKEITINDRNNTLTYHKQIFSGEELEVTERFKNSFNEINRFENWPSTFILSNYDQEKNILSFQREIHGIPIFSSGNHESVSEIGIIGNEITHLKFPLRFTKTPITIEESSKRLTAGYDIVTELKEIMNQEEFIKIENIIMGYTWQEDERESEVAWFSPEWYVLYEGNWQTLTAFLKAQEEVAYGF